MNKTNQGLVEHALAWVGQVYWYGTYCQPCTQSRLAGKARQYPSHYTAGRMGAYREHIERGKKCTDCVGLIKGYCWDGTEGKPRYASNGCPDTSANGMYRAAKVKGAISTLPDTPGLLVWRDGHIGVSMGDGTAVEARGFAYGVVRTRIKDRTWTNWCECPYIEYPETSSGQPEEPGALGGRTLRLGDKGADVTTLQQALISLGHPLPRYGADGDFGRETQGAVRAFQAASGLASDGIAGPKTLAALMDALAGDAPEEEPGAPAGATVTITGTTVHLRRGPGTQYASAAIARAGDRLPLAEAQGWRPVALGGEVLWVSGKYSKEV